MWYTSSTVKLSPSRLVSGYRNRLYPLNKHNLSRRLFCVNFIFRVCDHKSGCSINSIIPIYIGGLGRFTINHLMKQRHIPKERCSQFTVKSILWVLALFAGAFMTFFFWFWTINYWYQVHLTACLNMFLFVAFKVQFMCIFYAVVR